MKNILLIFLILFFIFLTKCDKNKDGKGNEDKGGGGKNGKGGGEENNEGVIGDNGGGENKVEEGDIEGGEVDKGGGKGNKGGGNGNKGGGNGNKGGGKEDKGNGNGNKGGGKEDKGNGNGNKGGGNGNGNKGGNGKGKQKKLINGIDADYYAPDDADGYSPAAKRRIMRYCTENQSDPECKPEYIITEGEIPEAPYGPGKGKGEGKKFPKFKKNAKKPPKKHKIKDPTEGLPNKYKKKLPPGKVKKMKKEDIDALRKNCPGNSCKEDKDEHKNSRATLADYDISLLKLAYPDKTLEEIDEYVETKMQRTYELKEIIYEKVGVDDFSKPADNGLYGHNLLTLEQAEAYIAQLNSTLEYSIAIPDESNGRRKRAGNLIYFKTSPTRKWPIGKPIPYGFDKSLNTRQRDVIRTCIQEITSKTCVTFTETNLDATSDRPPNISSIYFVRYPTTAYCGLSYIGVYTPSNPIYLSFLCNDMAGVACHEVMHALGVEHEHIRPDRDDSITVLWDNIDAQFLDYYVPADGSTYSSYGIQYKCDSIMHYSYKIGARDFGLHTMTSKVNPDINDDLMGQRKGLTQADVDAINKLYCYPDECTDTSNFCGAWATQGLCYCRTNGKPDCYMLQNCPNSCNFCNCTQYGD